MEQTPDQIRRERDLLALSVSALQEEVKRHKRISKQRMATIKSQRTIIKDLHSALNLVTPADISTTKE